MTTSTNLRDRFDEEIHEFRVVEREEVVSLESCTLYRLEMRCDDCGNTKIKGEATGDVPETSDELFYTTYEWYCKVRKEPFTIGYFWFIIITNEVDLGEANRMIASDMIMKAHDLAIEDAERDIERGFEEVIREVLDNMPGS